MSNLCSYSDAYILVKGTITVANPAAQMQPKKNGEKKVIFKYCAPFSNCIHRKSNTQEDDAHDIDVVMPMCNLIQYNDNYSRATGSRKKWHKNVEIMVPLKYLSNFWRTPEMSLTNYEINLYLNWSKKCITVVTTVANQGATFSITDEKLFVQVV